MKLVVSCALDGRDLAIVKSLININNIYGALSLTFVDDAKLSQILITKDYFDSGSVYYAINRKTGKKYPIEPSLNPQTVRCLFESLAADSETFEVAEKCESLMTVHQFIRQQTTNSNNEDKLLLKHPSMTLLLDSHSHVVFSTLQLTDELIATFSESKISSIQFSYVSSIISENFCHKMSFELFMWRLGYCLREKLIDDELQDQKNEFKLISWPNFGELPFSNEFIRLSSMLWKRSENYLELIESSGYGTTVVNQFLNASMMAGNVIASPNSLVPSSKVIKKESPFLRSLKKLFTFK